MPETDCPGDGVGLTADEIEELRLVHFHDTWNGDCRCWCGEIWPCLTPRLLDAYAALVARVEKLQRIAEALADEYFRITGVDSQTGEG